MSRMQWPNPTRVIIASPQRERRGRSTFAPFPRLPFNSSPFGRPPTDSLARWVDAVWTDSPPRVGSGPSALKQNDDQSWQIVFDDGAAPVTCDAVIASRGRSYVIVGVVRTSRSNALDESPTPAIYLSYRDNPSRVIVALTGHDHPAFLRA